MSGLLRRIKRSRTAAAGEPPAEGQDAATEGANTTAGTEPGGDAPAPAGDESRTAELTAATAPAIAADPDRPAGLDERAAVPPPTGRRGRLRRRLRYLRRVRELMLRDLGGLAYEVHRTGGGDFTAHSGVIGGKIERLALLDAETVAIERALGAPRSEAVVFEPGVGGTCDVCGELFGSAASYCSSCGTPTDPAARATPAEPVHEPRPVPPMPKAPGTGETAVLSADEGQPARDPAAADETGPADRTEPLSEPADETGPADRTEPLSEPAEDTSPADGPEPANAPAEAAEAPADHAEGRPSASNGRVDEAGRPPGLSSGDPLAAREPRE